MIATIINYCTNDYRFLSLCVDQVKKFSSQVIIPVADRFFDGEEESQVLLTQSYAQCKECQFIQYQFDGEKLYGFAPPVNKDDPDVAHYWHSTSRYIGYHFIDPRTEYVLFIDVDEIPDGERFLKWLHDFPYKTFDAIRFTSYMYFRKPIYRADKTTRNALLVKRASLSPQMLLDIHERKGTFYAVGGNKLEDVSDFDNTPLFHHYSFVKTDSEMYKKVASWGHRHDRDWKAVLNEELSLPFRGYDLIWGFKYKEVEPFCDPLNVLIPEKEATCPFPHVTKIDRESLTKKTILSLL